MTDETKPKKPRAPRKPRTPKPQPVEVEALESMAQPIGDEPQDFKLEHVTEVFDRAAALGEQPESPASVTAEAMETVAEAGRISLEEIRQLMRREKLRLYIHPPIANEDKGEGGVGRVIRYQHQILPRFDIEIVNKPEAADVIAAHIMYPDDWPRTFADKPIIAHVHGLYWAEYEWPEWSTKANAGVIRGIKGADLVTTPSEWVSRAVRRHTMRDAITVYHGVDADEWAEFREMPRQPYVYWDKNRVDPVCSPADLERLALMMPDVAFAATSWWSDKEPPPNVVVTGQRPYAEAVQMMGNAGAYLATTRETGAISVLQAMAAGVPVIGWNRAAMAEINDHTRGLRLFEHGDYEGMAAEIRDVLAADVLPVRDNVAYETVAATFPWEVAMARYADIYHDARAQRRAVRPRTSIIITNHNLERYLPAALDSIGAQTDKDWECIVFDDASANPEAVRDVLVAYLDDPRIRVLSSDENLYLAGARNAAIAQARGRYILPLDADDMLAPGTIKTLADALDADSALHIAYGNVLFVDEDGATPTNYGGRHAAGHSGWPLNMDPLLQVKGRNLLPYASMYRRDAWEQSGGYRTRCRTAEDADFWTRLVSYGFTARMVTESDTLIYRNREGSMSRTEPAVAWHEWFGWGQPDRLTAAPAGLLTNPQRAHVASFEPPFFSVVIPVGPGHERLVQAAVDSVEAQTFQHWECIVVWDSEMPPANLPVWARVLYSGKRDVAAARNAGIRQAKAAHIITLDADDLLQPNALETWHAAVRADPDAIWYSDFFEDPQTPGEYSVYRAPDWEPGWLTERGALSTAICAFPRVHWETIGGFREGIPWEDWAFQLDTAMAGVCWRRIPQALYTYRKHTGRRRDGQYANIAANKDAFAAVLGPIDDIRKKIDMACSSCGRGVASTLNVSATPAARDERAARLGNAEMVEMQYAGEQTSGVRFRPPSKREYWASRGDRIWALVSDVEWLEQRHFVMVNAPGAEPEKPIAAAVRRA